MHKISVIIPIYNVAPYLEKCVNGVTNQTYTNLEIILVNDGATDNSLAICEKLAAADKRIKIVSKENGGLSSARNAGLHIFTGDYVSFVDGDDYIENDMLEELLEAALDNDAPIAMCGRFNVKGEVTTPAFTFLTPQVWTAAEALARLLIWDGIDSSVCDKLFRRDLFCEARFPLHKYNEDIYVTPYLIAAAGKIAHIGSAKYNYVVREGSITSERFSVKKLHLLEATTLVQTFINKNYPHLKARAASFYYEGLIFLAGLIVKHNDKRVFKAELKRLKQNLRQAYFAILKSPYISRHNKLKATYLVL